MKYKYNSILQFAKKNGLSKEDVYFSLLARESQMVNNKIVMFDEENIKFVKKQLIDESAKMFSDEDLSSAITFLLERYSNQKGTGTYYTPSDVTGFMSSFLASKFEKGMTILDPTAGTGSLLFSLINKIDINLKDIYASDLDSFAIQILRQRLFTYFYKSGGSANKKTISENIYVKDILRGIEVKADMVISNPPYFETKKGTGEYGNIYADAFKHICSSVSKRGFVSIIVPISFQSTKRMDGIRGIVEDTFSDIDIYSFADRPDSLFKGVHQKLNIVNCSVLGNGTIRTSNYLMWRSAERSDLFKKVKLHLSLDLTKKIGDANMQKFSNRSSSPIENIKSFIDPLGVEIFISSRLAQFSKAFLNRQKNGEYISYRVKKQYANQLVSIFNSNAYYIYWTIVSDGWHNTKKIIENFKITEDLLNDKTLMTKGAKLLKRLEETKEYIGSTQIEYIYRHSKCLKETNDVDKVICESYGMSKQQTVSLLKFNKGVKHE